MLTGSEIRRKFLGFFIEKRRRRAVTSFSLRPPRPFSAPSAF
jgi:hypothetical protein